MLERYNIAPDAKRVFNILIFKYGEISDPNYWLEQACLLEKISKSNKDDYASEAFYSIESKNCFALAELLERVNKGASK